MGLFLFFNLISRNKLIKKRSNLSDAAAICKVTSNKSYQTNVEE